MRRVISRVVFRAGIAQPGRVYTVKQMFAAPKNHRCNRDVHFVDQTGLQVLPDRADATAEPDVLSPGDRSRSLQRGANAVGDEMEGRAAFHFNRLALMMRQHEHVGVIRRTVAPPALPAVVRPIATDGPEHVAAEDPCSDTFESAGRKVVVWTRGSVFAFEETAKCAGPREPFVKREPATPGWIPGILVRTGAGG